MPSKSLTSVFLNLFFIIIPRRSLLDTFPLIAPRWNPKTITILNMSLNSLFIYVLCMRWVNFFASQRISFCSLETPEPPTERHGLGSGCFLEWSVYQNHLGCEGSVEQTWRNPDGKASWRRLRPCPAARVSLGCQPTLAQQSRDSPQQEPSVGLG